MKAITITKNASVVGTHLQHEITLPYYYIAKLFGKHQKGNYKTDAEWRLTTPFGVGIIYNYKDGENYLGKNEGLAITDLTTWYIAGKNKETGMIIMAALEAFKQGFERY